MSLVLAASGAGHQKHIVPAINLKLYQTSYEISITLTEPISRPIRTRLAVTSQRANFKLKQ
jgi:hypothetical protein